MKNLLTALLLFLGTIGSFAAEFEDRFAVVLIDAETEAKLGAFPLDRLHYAKALDRAAELGARGVVFKFFFDQPRNAASDAALAKAMTNLPVALQACFDNSEAKPNPLPTRFILPGVSPGSSLAGESGWLPLPSLAAKARDVGFVDFDPQTPDRAPLIEAYQGKAVKNLALVCLELATGEKAVVESGKRVRLGAATIPVDERNFAQLGSFAGAKLNAIPFHSFLSGETPRAAIEGKTVLFGYDGPKLHSIETDAGPIHAHRYFILGLKSLHDRLEASRAKPAPATR